MQLHWNMERQFQMQKVMFKEVFNIKNLKGLEVVEHGCSLASLSMGETVFNAARGIDTHSYKLPLGVCAGVAPFNFPAMIPLWMIPLSITLGNTFILKPSERVPTTSILLAKYL